MLWLGVIIALIVLIIASICDIKKREVPDYLSYGLMFVAGAISVLYTIIYSDYSFLAQSVMGFIIGLAIAFLMFYLGQWGGGDSKLIMGLGAIIGFNIFSVFGSNNYALLILLANIILFGAIYGMIWSLGLALNHRKIFMKKVHEWSINPKIRLARRILLAVTVILIVLTLTVIPLGYQLMILAFIAIFFITFYVWVFVKIIEESCMIKKVPVSRLTEGDWIYKNVYIGKKLITGPKDLGISKEQIEILKKYARKGKIRTVLIKEGIPFIPAFLVAFIATIVIWYAGIF